MVTLEQKNEVALERVLFPVVQTEPKDLFQSSGTVFGSQMSSAIYAPTLNKVLHFGGKHYKLVDNETLIMPIYNRLLGMFGNNGFEVKTVNEDDRRFWIQFILHDKAIQVANKDVVKTMIEVQNSYDGTMKHSLGLSYYRQVCSNGLMAWSKESSVSKKHFDGLQPELEYALGQLDKIDEQLRKFRTLTERRVTALEVEEITKKIREHSGLSFPKKLIDIAAEGIGKEADIVDAHVTAWHVYNSFNGLLNHDERIGLSMELKEKIDRRVLETINEELVLN